jgi:hypothetical protein
MLLKEKVLTAALTGLLAGAAWAAESGREAANERNAQAGRTAATPAVDCDEVQGPARTACLAKGQSPLGAGGTSGATRGDPVSREESGQRSPDKSGGSADDAGTSSSDRR